MKPASVVAALLLPGLASCASVPDLEVSSRGGLVSPTATTFASERAGEGDVSRASAAVRQALTARGWSTDPADPAWRIETAYAERPASVGGYAGESPPAGSADWRIAPAPRPWWRREARLGVLVIRIVNADSGAEVVRAEARTRLPGRPGGVDLDKLAAAAVTEALAAAPAPSAATRQ